MEDIIKMLNNYPYTLDRIKDIEKQITDLKSRKEQLEDTSKAITISDMPRNPNVGDPTLSTVIKMRLEDIESKVQSWEELNKKRIEVETLINDLTPMEYTIIELRHFKGYKFYQIGRIIHFGKTQSWELHQEILKKIKDKFDRLNPKAS
jgi:vacuolar-type H+-ATPase subunit I/STV1